MPDADKLFRDTFVIVCPFCAFDFNHIGAVERVESNDNYEAWEGRGDLTRIQFECEAGHIWRLCFGFHKGQTFVFSEWQKEASDES